MRPILLFSTACVAVFALDVVSGSQISPWSLYLVPLLIAGWLFGSSAAVGVAALSSMLILLAALFSGHPFATWFEFGLSWCNRAATLLVVAWLVGVARRETEGQSNEKAHQRDCPF